MAKIQCLIGATTQAVLDRTYAFEKDKKGRFVCDVEDEHHAGIFLSCVGVYERVDDRVGEKPPVTADSPIDLLADLTKAELITTAENEGIAINKRDSKADILAAIRAARTAPPSDDGSATDPDAQAPDAAQKEPPAPEGAENQTEQGAATENNDGGAAQGPEAGSEPPAPTPDDFLADLSVEELQALADDEDIALAAGDEKDQIIETIRQARAEPPA